MEKAAHVAIPTDDHIDIKEPDTRSSASTSSPALQAATADPTVKPATSTTSLTSPLSTVTPTPCHPFFAAACWHHPKCKRPHKHCKRDRHTLEPFQPLTLLKSFDSFRRVLSPGSTTPGFPPDPIIAVGSRVAIVMVNAAIAIYNKCTPQLLFDQGLAFRNGAGFWDSVGATPTEQITDPYIVFDRHVCRFVVVNLGINNDAKRGFLYLAISKTPNPQNGCDWFKFRLERTGTTPTNPTPTFPDFPKLGYDRRAYYVTANNVAFRGPVQDYVSILGVAKASLLMGLVIPILDVKVFGAQFLVPAEVYDRSIGCRTMYFVEPCLPSSPSTASALRLYRFVNFAPTPIVTLVPVAAYGDPPKIAQLAATSPPPAPIYNNLPKLLSAPLQHGQLWTAHSIADPALPNYPNVATVRWYQIDVTACVPKLVQSQSIPPCGTDNLWNPHVNVDCHDNLAIGFSVAGTNRFASIGFTIRLATDKCNTTRPYVIAKSGLADYVTLDANGRNRWGDYSGLAVDPAKKGVFWLYNEYAGLPVDRNGIWITNVTSFMVKSLKRCSTKSATNGDRTKKPKGKSRSRRHQEPTVVDKGRKSS